jgi:polar amino acid transport system substrate-binding protein
VACGDDDSSDTTATTASGGSDTTAAQGGGAPEFTPVTPDTLTVVTSLPGPGFWDGGDTPEEITSGYEYGIVKAMQEKLGLSKLVVRNVNFDSLVAGLEQDYDVAFSQVTITDERKQVVDFSDPYWESDQGVLVRAGTSVASMEEARALLWGIQTGTTGADFVIDVIKPTKEPQPSTSLAAAFTALSAGQIDAVMMDTAIVLGEAARSGGKFEVAAQFKTGENYGAILPKGSPNVAAVNRLLAELKADGTLTRLAAENLGGDPSTVPVITP